MVSTNIQLILFTVLFPLSFAIPVIPEHADSTQIPSLSETESLDVALSDSDLNKAVHKRFLNSIKELGKGFGGWAIPSEVHVLSLPGYANWTSQGWNLRVHGRAYSFLPFSAENLDSIGSKLAPSYPREKWTPLMTTNIRNRTLNLLSRPKDETSVPLQFSFNDQPLTTFDTPQTDGMGGFDAWMGLKGLALRSGAGTGTMQTIEQHTSLSPLGSATSYLVPESGVTVICDIDDILREANVWKYRNTLSNTFADDYTPIKGMPELIASWATDPEVHFHYITTAPIMLARAYMSFIWKYFPRGSFDFRTLKSLSYEQILKSRRTNLHRIFRSFPGRKFVLLGDVSNKDAIAAYPELALLFPGQVSCILFRNHSATDPNYPDAYDTVGFKNVPDTLYQFFHTVDDLKGIDFTGGGCRNHTIQQTLTFGPQNVDHPKSKKGMAKADPLGAANVFLQAASGWL